MQANQSLANMKKLIILILCLLCIPQMDAQTKTQVLDDIESTFSDFISDINNLYEHGPKPHQRIQAMNKAFASPDYFIYNSEQQPSFTDWLTQYEKNILMGRYFEHQFTIKRQTVEKVVSHNDEDRRWQFSATLSRVDFDNNVSFNDDITVTVLWNGDGDYVSILEINGEWHKPLITEMIPIDEPVTTNENRFQVPATLKDWWWIILFIPIVPIILWIINKYKIKQQLSKAIYLYNHNSKDSAFLIFQNLESKNIPEVYYYLAQYYKPYGGYGVFRTNNQTKSFDYLYKAANAGHLQAMYELAIHRKGFDADEAKEWCKKAADKGHTDAMFRYSSLYAEGEEKHLWTLKAAQKNNIEAMLAVGYQYMLGKSTEKDSQKAIEWWMKAANAGNSKAMFEIGNAYYSGIGVERNTVTAKSWYEKAKETASKNKVGNDDTLYLLGRMYEKRYEEKKDTLNALDNAVECYSLIPERNPFYKRGQRKIEDIRRKKEAEMDFYRSLWRDPSLLQS